MKINTHMQVTIGGEKFAAIVRTIYDDGRIDLQIQAPKRKEKRLRECCAGDLVCFRGGYALYRVGSMTAGFVAVRDQFGETNHLPGALYVHVLTLAEIERGRQIIVRMIDEITS